MFEVSSSLHMSRLQHVSAVLLPRSHPWIEDSAMFEVARVQPVLNQQAWWDWPEGLRFRQPAALQEFR